MAVSSPNSVPPPTEHDPIVAAEVTRLKISSSTAAQTEPAPPLPNQPRSSLMALMAFVAFKPPPLLHHSIAPLPSLHPTSGTFAQLRSKPFRAIVPLSL